MIIIQKYLSKFLVLGAYFFLLVQLIGCTVYSNAGDESPIEKDRELPIPEKIPEKSPELNDNSTYDLNLFTQCCSGEIKRDLMELTGERRVFVQEIDGFRNSKMDAPFFHLNQTGGFRHFSGKEMIFNERTATSQLDENEWLSIRYSIKYDSIDLSNINTSAVLNKEIKKEHQGRFNSLVINTTSGLGEISVRFYGKPTGRAIDGASQFISDDIRYEKIITVTPSSTKYIVEVERNIPETLISQIEILVKGPANISFESISMEIDFDRSKSYLEYTALFLLSSLLDGFDDKEGLVFDAARTLRRSVGYSSAVTGMYTMALVAGADLGLISRQTGVNQINAILNKGLRHLTRTSYKGWLIHWLLMDGQVAVEYSVVDTALFYLPLLIAASYFDIAGAEAILLAGIKQIDFESIIKDGKIFLGFDSNQKPIPFYFDVVGGEFILIELLKSISNPDLAPLSVSHWETWKGIGFIAELSSLIFRQFGNFNIKDNVYKHNWLGERIRLYEEQKKSVHVSPIFGYSECEIVNDFGAREYAKFGSVEMASVKNREYIWFTPSYIFMTGLLKPGEFIDNFKFFRSYIQPISSVPECMQVQIPSNHISSVNYLQMSLRMIFSLLPIYHMLRSDCDSRNQVYFHGEKVLDTYSVLEKFYDNNITSNLSETCNFFVPYTQKKSHFIEQ